MQSIRDFFTVLVALFVLFFVWANLPAIQSAASSLMLPNVPIVQAGHTAATVQRLNQLDPAQYDSTQEYDTWSPSACSAAAIASVLNSYGRHVRVHDVLQVEIANGDITSDEGLLSHAAIARTATHYRFQASLNEADTLDHVIATANSGRPVIVNWPPGRFGKGHFVVVRGGNASTVLLADSSSYNYPSLPRAQFLAYWAGFSAVLTPQ